MAAPSPVFAAPHPQAEPQTASVTVNAGRKGYEQWRAEALIPQVFKVTADAGGIRSRVATARSAPS